MKLFVLTGLGLALLGCICIYLASPNQRWRAAPWPARPARALGAALLALGGLSLARDMHAVAAAFVFATALMLAFAVLPYVGALLNLRRDR